MNLSKLRMAAVFSIIIAILLSIVQEYTKVRVLFYMQIGMMFLAMILMTIDSQKNESIVSPKITRTFVVLGIIMLLISIVTLLIIVSAM